jgi:hypothetical protein
MILFHDIVQVRTTANLDQVFPAVIKFVAHAHAPQGGMAGFEAIQRDGAGLPMSFESLAKESSSGGNVPSAAEMRFHGATTFIYRPV